MPEETKPLTPAIDRLYLELAQFTRATTPREAKLRDAVIRLTFMVENGCSHDAESRQMIRDALGEMRPSVLEADRAQQMHKRSVQMFNALEEDGIDATGLEIVLPRREGNSEGRCASPASGAEPDRPVASSTVGAAAPATEPACPCCGN